MKEKLTESKKVTDTDITGCLVRNFKAKLWLLVGIKGKMVKEGEEDGTSGEEGRP